MSEPIFSGPEFEASWLAGGGLARGHGRDLIRLLEVLGRSHSLRDAARSCGLSYRYAWGLIGEGRRAIGAPLVQMGRGRGAQLTALGHRLLEADARVRQALGVAFERLRGEVKDILADALPGARPRLALHASHDLALPVLRELCERTLDLEIVFRGADDCLAALAHGECDLAGFHVADALPRAAAAAAALGRWLEPRKHALIHFVTREQGLIARPGSRIRGVHDLARPGVRFIHRQSAAGVPGSKRGGESVAVAVAGGRADAGFGLRAEAADLKLAFVPLAMERYYLACASAALRSPALRAVLEVLRSPAFAERVVRLPGYDVTRAGRREAPGTALTWVEPPRRRALA